MLNEDEYQNTLIEYLDTLRPNNTHRGKACCVGCDHSKCMFLDWCDVEPGAATIMFNAFSFNRMLEQWKKGGRKWIKRNPKLVARFMNFKRTNY